MDYIPDDIPYARGRYIASGAITVIPVLGRFILPDDIYAKSSRLYTDLLSDHYNRYTGGFGTTVMADYYADFGITAVVIGMFLLGCMLNYCDWILLHNNRPTLFSLTLALTFLSRSIYIARDNGIMPIKIAVTCYLITILANKFRSDAPQSSQRRSIP